MKSEENFVKYQSTDLYRKSCSGSDSWAKANPGSTKKGLIFQLDVTHTIQSGRWKKGDLFTIWGIMLDNALEACEKVD